MIETTTKCDLCKKAAAKGEAMLCTRIDQKMHDLCERCYGELSKLFAGTGRDVPPLNYVGLLEMPGEPYTNPLIPNNGYLGNGVIGITHQNHLTIMQNADMSSIPGGPQYTYTHAGDLVYDDNGEFVGIAMVSSPSANNGTISGSRIQSGSRQDTDLTSSQVRSFTSLVDVAKSYGSSGSLHAEYVNQVAPSLSVLSSFAGLRIEPV